ncbi:MAG: N-acetylmuramoyl-L-alanine amidase [Spirulinaceae cyanobacterium]
MRIYWFFLTLFSILLYAVPANAAQLLFWRFEAAQNRLTFTTDSGVQPQAQLIADPTRLVIDLPGIQLNRPTVNQNVGGAIASIRIGQFDNQTTRMVVEFAPGYTLDPQAVKIRGETPTQWFVELPAPERISTASTSSEPPANELPSAALLSERTPTSEYVKVTGLGFYVPLRLEDPDSISVTRDRDRVNISLRGTTLPTDLKNQDIPVHRYGVSNIEFTQTDNSANLALSVAEDSPDWWASVSRFGGLMIYPRGNIGNLAEFENSPDNSEDNLAQNNRETATIQSINLGIGGSQLLIQSDRDIQPRIAQNGNTYQIVIPNARLGSRVSDRDIPSGLSINRFQIRENNGNVVITVIPNRGYTVGNINRRSDRVTTISLDPGRVANNPSPSPSTSSDIPIPVPPPENPSPPPPTRLPSTPRGDLPRSTSGRVVAVIDPGHGGRDPGAIGIGGLREKDVVLPISLEVARLLEQQGVRVILTRSDDRFISLAGRAQLANRSRATVFVSIHANAISMSRPDVNGVETFYFVSGRQLAEYIQGSIMESFDMNNRGVKRARFYVLRNTSMPSALVETGFVTGREDAPRLANPQFRDDMAYAIARGILRYLQAQGL